MAFEIKILDEHQAAVITMSGQISDSEIADMRSQTVALVEGINMRNFVVDISSMLSIESGSTFATFELGDKFRSTGFPLDTKTAVIMPIDLEAKAQAELLHTVEINRGRGALKYVDSVDDALYWLRSSAD